MNKLTGFSFWRINLAPALLLPLLTMALLVLSNRLQAQSLKIGFTRIDYVIAQLPESKQVNNQLSIQQTQAENELKRLQKEFEDKLSIYQKEGAQLSEAIRKDRETELQKLQSRVQEFSQSAQKSLQDKYNQLMGPILTKVQQAIDTVAKQNGYQYILNVGSGDTFNVLYADEAYNITDLVLKQLGIKPAPAPESPKKTTPVTTPPRKNSQ
ncbi:OmpH family outer membrane protein [Spirosoma sp. SC4-14]|uniref:OmpH family outer membrane protein n=1 Tax=Spirosoma sp. SC4-14 TaxID=3128900 RepID=UPI0030CCA154